MENLQGTSYQVLSVKKGQREKKAPLPFTTSTLQPGSGEGAEFFNAENDAAGAAAVRRN